ncbi:MAG: nucleoside deaminase [Proteobacteria bacterium]|nr:nucleoside deaminase [Pseudomonadota bacterium]
MPQPANTDERWMREALTEARKAADRGEVPIGAVAVRSGKIVGRAHNVREQTQNPLGHAEILLVGKLAKKFKSWRLDGVTLYVTCEPCLMCAGAMLQARVPRVVYGCRDEKAGAMGTLYDLSNDPRLNHSIEVTAGVLESECAAALSDFFRVLRNSRGRSDRPDEKTCKE